MKAKYKFSKELAEIATRMGLEDKAEITGMIDAVTKQPRFELVNNNRRFVRGLLRLPLSEQRARINYFKQVIAEQEAVDKAKEGVQS